MTEVKRDQPAHFTLLVEWVPYNPETHLSGHHVFIVSCDHCGEEQTFSTAITATFGSGPIESWIVNHRRDHLGIAHWPVTQEIPNSDSGENA